MAPEITITDWIAAIATVAACIATLILAIIALRQAQIMKAQTELTRQQLDIIKYHEQERRKEKGKADLKPQLIKKDTPNGWSGAVLHIENKGKAKARDIRILIDGKPPHEYLPIQLSSIQDKDIPRELDPGATWSPQLRFPSGINNKFDIKINWLDDSGEPRSVEQHLIPMMNLAKD
jgi:hypothetical protein